MSPAEARVKEEPSGMTDAEWNQRINLAACYRLVAYYGWDDLVDTHISARVPGPVSRSASAAEPVIRQAPCGRGARAGRRDDGRRGGRTASPQVGAKSVLNAH